MELDEVVRKRTRSILAAKIIIEWKMVAVVVAVVQGEDEATNYV